METAHHDRLPPAPQVFELYVKGLVAETPATALAFLEQALKAAPQFDRARLAIWDIHSEASDYLKALPDSRRPLVFTKFGLGADSDVRKQSASRADLRVKGASGGRCR